MLNGLMLRGADGRLLMIERKGGEFAPLLASPLNVTTLMLSKSLYPTAESANEFAAASGFKPLSCEEMGVTWRLRSVDGTTDMDATMLDVAEGVQAQGVAAPAPAESREGQVHRSFGIIRAVEKNGQIEGFGSFRSVDRYSELVNPKAFEKRMDVFKKHPVMLLGHESNAQAELPIGNWADIRVQRDGLFVKGPLLKEHRRYEEVKAAAEKGLLALSIGFIPVKGHEPTEEELREFGPTLRYVWDEVELLEISLVSIPANRDTLAQLRAMVADSAKVDVQAAEWALIVRDLKAVGDKARAVARLGRAAGSPPPPADGAPAADAPAPKAGMPEEMKPQMEALKELARKFFEDLVGIVEQMEGGEDAPPPDPAAPDAGTPEPGKGFELLKDLNDSLSSLKK